MKKDRNQREELLTAQQNLGIGPVAMAREMGVHYDTYKSWLSERRTMPAVGWRCLELLLHIKIMEKTLE
jgi:hypothetical protein